MEPAKGVLASLWQFICFLPYFTGLLLLGVVKGIVFCPFICLIMTIGNSAIILGLLLVHAIWTCYCTLSAKQLGPILKFVICLCLPVGVVLWPVIGIVGTFLGGALYGFLSPIFATFDAVGEGKSNPLFHSFYNGTWSTIRGSFTIVRDFKDVCFHSYFSLMDDLRQVHPDRKYYEIRLLHLPGAIVAAFLGILVDIPTITLIALCKGPFMLFKGWRRLFHDLIGREGPFLETICVPIAGLVILLWPLAVVGAVLGSVVSCLFLGAYAGVVVYQESSFFYGLCYVVASISIYDEYSNDILDMPEGSCFPRPKYRKKDEVSLADRAISFSRPGSFKKTPSRSGSTGGPVVELKPLELLDGLFKECRQHGEVMVLKGLISYKDIEEAKSSKGNRVISIGLPAYCLLQSLLRSVKANSTGILLSDNATEITSRYRLEDAFFEWFFNPFLILKEQIKASNLSVEEEEYLGRLVLLHGDPERLKSLNVGSPSQSERKRAELDAFARRLQGITKSMSRYPTFRRHFGDLVKTLSEDLDKMHSGSSNTAKGSQTVTGSRSAITRLFSQKSYKRKSSMNGSDQESQPGVLRDVEIA